jgi:hypothetical protein
MEKEAAEVDEKIAFEEHDSDFEYYGSIYDEDEYDEEDLSDYEHDMADAFEAKFFGGKRKFCRDNEVLRASNHYKSEKVNTERYVKVRDVRKKEDKEFNKGEQFSIIKAKSYQKNARFMVTPPWAIQNTSAAVPVRLPFPPACRA